MSSVRIEFGFIYRQAYKYLTQTQTIETMKLMKNYFKDQLCFESLFV
jgi:hypothetical protein